jgi:hypothetical protein
MTKLRSVLAGVLLLVSSGVMFGQTLSTGIYWEYPSFLVDSPARYFQAGFGAERVVVAWQELVGEAADEASGEVYISLRSSSDGTNWDEYPRAVGPFEYVGKEIRVYSLAVDEAGTAYIALSADKDVVEIYRIASGADSLERLAVLQMETTTVAPTVFVRSDGGLLLFATQDTVTGSEQGLDVRTTSIVYSLSDSGIQWSTMKTFVDDETIRVSLHLLPRHAVLDEQDYVVFQALITDPVTNRQRNQIYLKKSTDSGVSWSPAARVTDFGEFIGVAQRQPDAFNNENASLHALEDRLVVTWERSIDSPRPQIYYAEIAPDGEFLANPEPVTNGVRTNRAPRAFSYGDRTYLLWFDNRAGADHVILGVKSGIVWMDFDLSEEVAGRSQFGLPFLLNDELFFLWENRNERDSSIVYLRPDRTAPVPEITPQNFESGQRHRQDTFSVTWNLPDDSSRIDGFSVLWDQKPDSIPPPEVLHGINDRAVERLITEDGDWYIHVRARDRAGNWSAPATVSVYRDTTPPEGVVFGEPEMDSSGFLVSNTYSFVWETPYDDDVAGYSYRVQYLDTFRQTLQYTAAAVRDPARGINLVLPQVAIRNYDNGLWALSVVAIDTVGNISEPETLFFRLDKYVPVTYITSVGSREDDLGRLSVSILGRGFSAGGAVSSIILDADRQGPPWDYEFTIDTGAYSVVDDRTIKGLVLEGIDQGDYWIAVDHPDRGIHFAPKSLAVKPMGKVKFGDFNFRKPIRIYLNTRSRYAVSFNIVTALAIVALLAVLILFSAQRIAVVAREGRMLQAEVRKLLSEELPQRQKMERIAQMKKKGFGLRLKFSLVTIMLVIATVLIVAFPLTILMTGTQEELLGVGLEEKASVMLESAASGAASSLPNAADEALQLGLLTRQTQGVADALYLTITGESIDDTVGYNYVWASNDPAIANKISTPEMDLGSSILVDEVSPLVAGIAREIEERAAEQVSALRQEAEVLQAQQTQLILTSAVRDITSEEDARIDELGDQIQERRRRITEILLEIGSEIHTVPEYDPVNLSRETTRYTFYKPVVYLQEGDNRYFHGVVRLGVSIERILGQIEAATRSLFVATGIIALVAIGIGIISALILSSIIIRPIRRLAQAVEEIRDTEDKESLKELVIDITTKDEIADLAESIKEMSLGLAAAAAANKDLIVGKETQKMFTPLITDPSSGRKLTTASELNDDVEFFGYYEGAKGVSGDYFDYAKLDDQHYAIIKCDVAGKGVPASLIMVEVATIFLDYFRNWNIKSEGIHLEKLVYRINDLVEQRGFTGRFAALLVVIINVKTGATYLCHAGDNLIHIYDNSKHEMVTKTLPEAPATGVFPSDMVEMGSGFSQIPHVMKHGDSLLLFTDGVEEDKRYFRDEQFGVILCDDADSDDGAEHGNHRKGDDNEELGIPRIYTIVNAVMDRGTYRLEKHHNPIPNEVLTFDFSSCVGTVRESVLAMAALDKVFRIIPDPGLGANDRIRVDVNIDEFLKEHFDQYGQYFGTPVPDANFPEYVYYTHLREDDQYDDLTILGVRKV